VGVPDERCLRFPIRKVDFGAGTGIDS